MGEAQRVSRSKAKSEPSAASGGAERAGATSARSPAAADWAAAHLGSAFPLAGVQRKVEIGPPGDAYEREADRVSADVASGRSIAPSAISPIGSLPSPVGQRAPAPDDKKKDDKPKTAAVQKAAAPEDKKKDEKPKAPAVQKAAAPDDHKKDDKPKTPAVQKAAAPEDKKKDEKPKTPAVQKAAAPDDKKKGEKPKAPAVQKAAAPEDKKKDEKPKAPAVQKAAAPEDKKKDEKPKTPAVQKAATPDDKKKDEKPKSPAVQKAAAPEDRKTDEKPKAPAVQKAAAPDEKKKDDKPKAPAVQKADKPADKKPEEKPKEPAAVQKAAGAAPAAAGTPKEKDKKEASEKSLDEKLASAPVQKADAPKTPIEKEKQKEQSKEAASVQRAAGSAGTTPAMENAAASAINSKGAGEPINAPTRGALESRMGVDLGGVRVHNDRAAHETADAINARAFTHGNDIWLGRNQSQSDTSLMAHEATHVVQQAGGVHRMLVQRADPPPAADDGGTWDYEGPEGKVRKGSKFLIPTLRVPTFKKTSTPAPVTLPKKTEDPRPDDQRTIWEKEARGRSGIDTKLAKKKKDEKAPPLANDATFLKLKGKDTFIIGNDTAIKNRLLRPYWDKTGKINFYDVDHKLELQLGGENAIGNMWLLDSAANQSSGREIRAEKTDKIQKLLDAAQDPKKTKGKPTWVGEAPTIDTIRSSYTVTFEKVVGGLPIEGEPAQRWNIDEIGDDALQLDPLKVLSKKEIDEKELQGSPQTIAIYTNPTGGGLRKSEGWKDDQTEKKEKFDFGKMLQVDLVRFDKKSKKGSVEGHAFRGSKIIEEINFTFDLQESAAVEYGGYVSSAGVTKEIQSKLKAKGLSPIEISQAEMTEKGLVGRGKLAPTVPLLKDLQIDLVLDGENVYLSKVFSAGDFNLPGPIKVTGASLEVFAGTQGIGARGDLFLKIDRVGKGRITGKVSTAGGFELEGQFDFDSELFDPAMVKLWYKQDKFGGEGKLGIPEGKVKGIKSASLSATIDGDKIDATGSVKPSIPGIEQGDLTFSYDPTNGVVISGKLELKKDIPGLEGGSVQAELSKKPGDEKWRVKASGEATPKIPGVSSKLAITYDDGAFDAVVTAGYEKGMLKGSITVGATNRPVGDDGKPAGPPPDKGDKVTLYGGGSVTLKIAPWLQATAAIKLLPNGEIEVTGEIGLPAALEIFKEKKLDKNIFKIGIDIPIVGVSVAGQRIGIFANISGGLDLSAGIGPGELNQLKLSVTYNPAHEEDTKVSGDANLHIPAHAGLRLFVRGSLGVGIPIVSASAGLEIGGSLGLEGALDAGVHVDWSPATGLDLTAQASIYVEPKLKFDITGFVLVEADLLVTTIELYSKKWQLASFEYGSGLKFGLKFPIHYKEGQEFNLSLSDVEFQVPEVDPGELLEGLIKKIA